MANSMLQARGVGRNPITPLGATDQHRPIPSQFTLGVAERRYLTEQELANRWGMSPKTLSRWRGLGKGPVFAKFSKKVGYPIDGDGGVLDWEQRILYRSTSERVAK